MECTLEESKRLTELNWDIEEINYENSLSKEERELKKLQVKKEIIYLKLGIVLDNYKKSGFRGDFVKIIRDLEEEKKAIINEINALIQAKSSETNQITLKR